MSWRYYSDYGDREASRAGVLRKLAKLEKKGEDVEPLLVPAGKRKFCTTFYGQAWCDNLESYSDFENRLPRGRSYLRQGNVRGLRIDRGSVFAHVVGSDLYEVDITIKPVPRKTWKEIVAGCAGQIRNLVDLLGGRLSTGVMTAMTDRERGLFPKPRQIQFNCSCPDYATMCKHVAAVLYGVGVKLDTEPELLFTLRQVDHHELIAAAATHAASLDTTGADSQSASVLAAEDLSNLFGIEITEPEAAFFDLPS